METLIIYVTYKDEAQAQEISSVLVESRLVACANMFPAHRSLYWWDGGVQSASEVAVIYKTVAENFDRVREVILDRHSYECPCIVGLPIEKGHFPFLQWIEAETRG